MNKPHMPGVAPEPASAIRTTLGLLPVLAISAVAGSPVFAQGAGEVALDEVVVVGSRAKEAETGYRVTSGSSTKITTPLLNTPKTVQVVTQKQIEERGAVSVYDVLRTTPGVTIGTGEGGNPMGDRPFIRGYEASTDMMVDGVRSIARTSHEAFNVESIELVKGAAGAYSGRGGAGGSLNMVSKQARIGEAFSHYSATVGNASQKRASLDTNFALGENAAARINLFLQDSNVPGRGGIKDDKQGIALALTTRLGDATKLSFNAYYSRSDGTPDFGLPFANAAYVTATGDTTYGDGTVANPWKPLGNANHKAFYGIYDRDFREVINSNATVRLDHEFSGNFRVNAQLTAIASEQSYIVTRPTLGLVNAAGAAATGLPVGSFALMRDNRNGYRKTETIAFSTNFSGEGQLGGIEHNYAFGFELSNEKLRSASLSGFPTANFPDANYLNPDPTFPVNMAGLTWGALSGPTTTKSRSLYIADQLIFNDQWQANLGLRYEMFDVAQPNGLRRKDNIWSYQAGLIYKPAPNGTIYASISTSASPSGQCAGQAGGSEGAGACTLTAANVNLEPEKTRAFELGTKWDLLDNRLSLTAALFRTEKTNARVIDPVTGVANTVGRNQAQGIELGIAGQINDRWSISGGYTYTDAKIVDDGAGGNAGNKMHYIAPHSFGVWSTYAVNDRWTVGGGATFLSSRFMNADNTASLPAHWRFDAMASYRINDRAGLQLNINNLFDAKLYDASHVGLFANVQAGRSATLKLDLRF